jgi:hypothetical protein
MADSFDVSGKCGLLTLADIEIEDDPIEHF